MTFDDNKQYLIFYDRLRNVSKLALPWRFTFETLGGTIFASRMFADALKRFDSGETRILILPQTMITGWRSDLSPEQAEVIFTFEPTEAIRAQGEGRLKGPVSAVIAKQRAAADERAEENRIARIKGRSIYGE